jgi:hypothetical protein
MRPFVEFRRSGGLGGFNDRAVLYPDGRATVYRGNDRPIEVQVSPEVVAKIRSSLDEAREANLHGDYLPPRPVPDGFQFSIEASDLSIRTADPAMPQQLRTAVELLSSVIDGA